MAMDSAETGMAAQQELQRVSQINFTRARIHMGELLDALSYTCRAAEAGEPSAKADLQAFLQALERARTAAAGVVSANGVHLRKG
jgi:hypothetical protein